MRWAVELALTGVCCLLLGMLGWREQPGDVWAMIGLVLAPVCLTGVLAVVVYEWRMGYGAD